jgi:hypothetical protein
LNTTKPPLQLSLESDGFEQHTKENLKCRKFITDLSDLESLKFNVKWEEALNRGTLHEGIKCTTSLLIHWLMHRTRTCTLLPFFILILYGSFTISEIFSVRPWLKKGQ